MIAPPRFAIREPFAGGLEAQVWHTCAALTRAGVEVDLYGAAGSDFAAEDFSFPLPRWDGAHATDTTLPRWTALAHDRLMHELVERLAAGTGGYDIVHNQSLYPQILQRASELPVPLITTLHTPPFHELTDVLDGADGHFVAVSGHVRDSWSMLSPAASVIHNGIELDRWMPGRGGDDIAWFGRIVPEKAPHLAIDAARLAGRRLLLAGRIGDVRYFDSEIRPRLGARARYLGELRQSGLSELTGRCGAVLVTPMWPEPFGLVAAEAAACGTPVVAFAAGGLPEVVVDGLSGVLVPPGDVSAMARGIDEVAGFDRRTVRATARERFGLDRMARRYLTLYASLSGTDQRVSA